MSNIFLINLSEDIINMWRRGNSGLMLSQDVLDKFNIRFCEQLVEYYLIRKKASDEFEHKYIAPVIVLRGKYSWSIYTSVSTILLELPNQFVQDEVDFLKEHKVPFYLSEEVHSDNKYSKSAEIAQLHKRYLETAPKPIGFDTSQSKEN